MTARDRDWLQRRALDSLVKAQFLTITGYSKEARTEAILYAALALFNLCQLDPGEECLSLAETWLQEIAAKGGK